MTTIQNVKNALLLSSGHFVQIGSHWINWAENTFENKSGIYAFFHHASPVYIGESNNVARRIKEQISDDNKGELRGNIIDIKKLSRLYIKKEEVDNILRSLSVSVAYTAVTEKVRKEFEYSLIREYKPIYNIKGNPLYERV